MEILPVNYIDTFIKLKDRIRNAQYRSISAANSEMILAYIDIGKTISKIEDRDFDVITKYYSVNLLDFDFYRALF